jgi:hypothetical protein
MVQQSRNALQITLKTTNKVITMLKQKEKTVILILPTNLFDNEEETTEIWEDINEIISRLEDKGYEVHV